MKKKVIRIVLAGILTVGVLSGCGSTTDSGTVQLTNVSYEATREL